MTPRESILLRYINDSTDALRELHLAAVEGSTASEWILRHVADDLIRMAADAKIARTAKPKGKSARLGHL